MNLPNLNPWTYFKAHFSDPIYRFHKMIHIVVGMIIACFISQFNVPMALVITFIIALIKEGADHDANEPIASCIADIIITMIGGILGVITSFFI